MQGVNEKKNHDLINHHGESAANISWHVSEFQILFGIFVHQNHLQRVKGSLV